MTDPRIAILSRLSDPPFNEITETRCVPWDEAVELLDRYRATVLKEVAEKVRADGPAAVAAWFNYHRPDGSQPSHSERVNGAAQAVAELIVPEADAHG